MQIEFPALKRHSARAGEKSKLPNCSHLIPRNRLRYGSQTEARNCPNLEYESPGIQVSIILMKQIVEYRENAVARRLKNCDKAFI